MINKTLIQLKIDKERYKLECLLNKKSVVEKDIINIMDKDENYGITFTDKEYSSKELYLKYIYRAPYLLCDQEVSDNIKILLPSFIKKIYNLEYNELNYLLNRGDISKEEYEERLEYLNFTSYESSEDGKNIAKNGKCIGVKNKVLKY